MIPKIGGMADAIYQGVHEAVIIDGRVPHSILLELFSDRGSGTRFTAAAITNKGCSKPRSAL